MNLYYTFRTGRQYNLSWLRTSLQALVLIAAITITPSAKAVGLEDTLGAFPGLATLLLNNGQNGSLFNDTMLGLYIGTLDGTANYTFANSSVINHDNEDLYVALGLYGTEVVEFSTDGGTTFAAFPNLTPGGPQFDSFSAIFGGATFVTSILDLSNYGIPVGSFSSNLVIRGMNADDVVILGRLDGSISGGGTEVPEPGTLTLLAAGTIGLVARKRKTASI